MYKKEVRVEPVKVKAWCEECDIEMNYIGSECTPGMYKHKCPKCGKELCLKAKYPKIEFKEINKD